MKDSPLTEEPLIRVMALHALAYCERLFYLEEVEEIRLADKAVMDGRRLHEQIPEYVEIDTYHLQSDRLGIQGKVDCVRTEKGEWIPFEYKKGDLPRYFPPDRDLLDLHVIHPGTTVRKSSGTFQLEDKEGNVREYPSETLGSITIHGNSQITTQAIHLAAWKGVHIHWMTAGGKYIGSLTQAAGGTQRRLRQYAALTNPELTRKLAQLLVQAKVESQLRYILRLTRDRDRESCLSHIETIRQALKQIRTKNPDRDQLLGFEGMAAKAYFQCISRIIGAAKGEHHGEDPKTILFDGRNKRRPRDPANAVLSFLYSLLYRDCVQAIITVGLDPTIGFYHQPRSAAYPLALDVMELFRVMLCDTVLIGTIHRKQWHAEEDFIYAGKQVWLSDLGKKKAITAYEKRKQDSWKHPVVGYSLTYDRTIELEVRLLEKEWTGAPGLFAMNRIR
ncbi:hypothetical protein BSNK01_18500 [Bacillaceae bacterium]